MASAQGEREGERACTLQDGCNLYICTVVERITRKGMYVEYFYIQSKTKEGQPAAFGIFDGLLHSRRRHWGGLHCCIRHRDHKIKQVSWQTHFWDLVSLTHGFQLAIICATTAVLACW